MTSSLSSSQRTLLPPSSGPLPPPRFEHLSAPLNVIFLLLIVLHFLLHYLCLSGRFPQRWSWLYFLFQAGCVFTLSLMWSDLIITLGFSLVLVIEALNVLKQIRHIMIIVACFLALFLATAIIQILQMTIWMTLESVLLLVVFLIGWILLLIQQIHARSRLEAAHLQLAAFAMRMEELTLVNERQRLARELHDTLAQDLVGLTLQLERIDQHLEKKRYERARELAQQAMSRARTTLAEARTAIDDLRANALGPHDLLQALHREIYRFRESTSIACIADIAVLAQTPSALCEHVLRAITEGLTNVARHSQAQQVHICAQFQEDFLTIEIGDDGRGFESAALATLQGHYGLLGVRERAHLCGGHLTIESAPGHGTMLRLHLPTQTRGEVLG
ncbi:sensor histidine kinase [Ktedonobacter sp. SOSP1-52]|uniref:sensor histidine kinase n=1 Tax=Ktedonobacter sp. SOSP1-52 TaxID=2778366 RepID=UPI001915EB0F|nr:sensor histidine kinase [Ktedonobacter sp. SOSP1-52]